MPLLGRRFFRQSLRMSMPSMGIPRKSVRRVELFPTPVRLVIGRTVKVSLSTLQVNQGGHRREHSLVWPRAGRRSLWFKTHGELVHRLRRVERLLLHGPQPWAMLSMEEKQMLSSALSMGFMLSCTIVSRTVLSKRCMAATTWRLGCSTGRPPDFVKASRRSKASSFSFFCASPVRVDVVGSANRHSYALRPDVRGCDDRRANGVVRDKCPTLRG